MNAIECVAVETGRQSPSSRTIQKATRGKESMDRISGSGVFPRHPDTIVRITPHKVDDACAVEMTVRNHPPQEPFVVQCEHPLMAIDSSWSQRKQSEGDIYRENDQFCYVRPRSVSIFEAILAASRYSCAKSRAASHCLS